MLRVGSDFSGVGAFNQALIRLGVEYKEVFACDMDKFARETFIHNYGEPEYYPTNVYDREIPSESLDIYMTSPPCQAFSLAGKRLGKEDKRGILFFNSHEFIQVNKPRFFIFENVKGLLSDDGGRTFQEWVNMLGGKSVNGVPVLFPYEESVPYHLYWQVLNAKNHGVPQNRERVFLIGIRDDVDNHFQFPREEHLTKRLKDVLEEEVFEKFYLSNERINTISNSKRGIGWTDADKKEAANCIISGYNKQPTDGEYIKIKSNLEKYYLSEKMLNHLQNHNRSQDFIDKETINTNCITSNYSKQSSDLQYLRIKSATSKGYEEATEDIWIADFRNDEGLRIRKDNISPCMAARKHSETDVSTMAPLVGYHNEKLNQGVEQTLDTSCNQAVIKSVQIGQSEKTFAYKNGTIIGKENQEAFCIRSVQPNGICINDYKIRRLTPRECFRLMDFPDTFTWPVSDSQAYKQAGNSIVVNVLYKILKQLPL